MSSFPLRGWSHSSAAVVVAVAVCAIGTAYVMAGSQRFIRLAPPDTIRSPRRVHVRYSDAQSSRRRPSGVEILQQLDSSGTVTLSEQVNGVSVSVPRFVELDSFLAERRTQISRRLWDSLSTSYDLKRALSGGNLAKLLSQSSNIAIPLPPNPLTTIFGKPEISISVNGEVNLRAGWRWDSQNLGASSAFGQSQSAPLFSQNIQLNVSARIGDKFRLGTDWNTMRQFEFDNRFKIGYEGYDDDIIKLVELGNVQLPTNSAFISGSQALFGARSDFQFGPLFLKAVASQRRAERRFLRANSGAARSRFVLRAYDYAENHYFLDTAYKALYRQYWQLTTPVPVPAGPLLVKEIEVYESTADVRDQAVGGIEVIAYDTLSPIRFAQGERYPPAMKSPDVRIQQGRIERGRFVRLDPTRFTFNPNLGTLDIWGFRRDRTYAVAYRTEGASPAKEDDLYHGTLSATAKDGDTLILKLIYRPNLQPGFPNLWARQMRNIYFINATNVSTQDARIDIYYLRTNNDSTDILEGTSDKLVTALGVDRVNNATGQPPGDGLFDFTGGAPPAQQQAGGGFTPGQGFPGSQQQTMTTGSPYFNAVRGEIIFPWIEPFREGLDSAFARRGNPALAQQYYYSAVYDVQKALAQQQTAQDRWLIIGEVQGQSAGRISLGFNVAPGSVRVFWSGRQLRENDDYVVDYYSGTVSIRNPQAQAAGSDLIIEYESNDVMNIQTRTLLGMRADLVLSRTRNASLTIGSTLMNFNTAALVDRVRLGEEPLSNTMLGFDANVNWNAQWLTDALNWLPFYSTNERSTITFRGEWAQQLPKPNKRISEIPVDNNQAAAYIDDFEGAQRFISMGLTSTLWTHSSPPVDSSIEPLHEQRALYRGKLYWYNFFLPRVPIVEIYPNRQTVQGQSRLSPLVITFDPDRRGIYNANPNYIDSLNPRWDSVKANPWQQRPANRERIWAGMQRLLSTFNSNFDLENIDFIDVMMRIEEREPGARMFIDLGQISEDIIPNYRLDTEDGITAGAPIPNGRIDPGEDVGIDALDDAAERAQYPYPLNLEEDPARDNYAFNFSKPNEQQLDEDFLRWNNYEGNASQSELGQFPDTEILNKQNGQTISLDDSYFSYEVNLDPSDANPQVVGGGTYGWRLYRIPLRGAKRVVGNPLFSNIQYIRVWFKGGRIKVSIADWRFVGSQWQRVNYAQVLNSAESNDTVIRVSFVNREENSGPPDYYTMPPGVKPPRNLANPDFQNDILLNEQSLAIGVTNLQCGDERKATRFFFRPQDFFFYRTLKVFIKGVGGQDYVPPDSLLLTPSDTAAPQYFIRFGIDSANYYEYRAPIVRQWRNVCIPLQALAAIKAQRDSSLQWQRLTYPVPGDPLARFAIQGNPLLTRVMFISIGIANPRERCPQALSTTIWADELRLVEPDARNDWAATASLDVKLADLGTLRTAYTQTNPFFHRLEERFGTREQAQDFTFALQIGAERFLPKDWKDTRIPIAFARTVRERNPVFAAQSDVNVEQAAVTAYNSVLAAGGTQQQALDRADYVRRRARTRIAQMQWSILGFRFGIPTSFWLIRETLNRLVLGYAYTQEAEQSPVYAERFRWQWDFTAQYALPLPATIAQLSLGGWMQGIPLLDTYSGWKINLLPQNISLSTRLSRYRRTEQSWFLPFPSPVERGFTATNAASIQWKFTEGGFLSPMLDYQLSQTNTLVPLELDPNGRQRTGSELARTIFMADGRFINFGTPVSVQQTTTFNFRPLLPNIGNLNRFLDLSGTFSTTYMWNDPLQPDPRLRDAVKQVSYNNSIRWNANLRLQAMSNSWFGITQQPPRRVGQPDSAAQKSSSVVDDVLDVFRSILFDYQQVTVSFTQNNTANTPGAFGGTGVSNLWGRLATGRPSDLLLGPSAAYQLGLVRYPHAGVGVRLRSRFPFVEFWEDLGIRPPNAQFQDNLSQQTGLEFRTTRPLWKGATLELNWRTQFSINRNQLTTTDVQGVMTFTNVTLSEQYQRTFLSAPYWLMLAAFNNRPETVVERYRQLRTQIIGTRNEDSLTIDEQVALQNAMTTAFISGLQAFEFLPGVLQRYLPQVNWSLRWEGIEKFWLLQQFAQRITLEHSYQTLYTESAYTTDNGRVVNAQTVQMQFQPLVGAIFSFDEKKLKGLLTANLRYNTRTNYSIAAAARTLTEEVQNELALNANYTLRGFSFPLLGIDLKNDVEFSLITSYRASSRRTFLLGQRGNKAQQSTNGTEVDGRRSILIEPRARYTLSRLVTATAFFRYNGEFTTGASNPGFSVIEVGVELRIAISGGR